MNLGIKKIVISNKYYLLAFLLGLYLLNLRDFYINDKLNNFSDLISIIPSSFLEFLGSLFAYWLWIILLSVLGITLIYISLFYLLRSKSIELKRCLKITSSVIILIVLCCAIFVNINYIYILFLALISELLRYQNLKKTITQ